MESILDKLPNDIITEIMSYSHPDVTFKFKNVINQSTVYMNEYNYYRPNERKSFNRWFLFYSYYKYY